MSFNVQSLLKSGKESDFMVLRTLEKLKGLRDTRSEDLVWEETYDAQCKMTKAEKILSESWFGDSVLASVGRRIPGVDSQMVIHTEDTYVEMITQMVDRVVEDPRNARNIAYSRELAPIDRGATCVSHPYGRVVAICECQNSIGRMLQRIDDRVNCGCTSYNHTLFHQSKRQYNNGVVCVFPHQVGESGCCEAGHQLGRRLQPLYDHLSTFARLARYLYRYAKTQYVIQEVLGGPCSGYLQAAVMIFLRFSYNDCIRVVTEKKFHGMQFDVPLKTFDQREAFTAGVVMLRTQGNYRGWMNNLVQNYKRQQMNIPLVTDEEFHNMIQKQVPKPIDRDIVVKEKEVLIAVPDANRIGKRVVQASSHVAVKSSGDGTVNVAQDELPISRKVNRVTSAPRVTQSVTQSANPGKSSFIVQPIIQFASLDKPSSAASSSLRGVQVAAENSVVNAVGGREAAVIAAITKEKTLFRQYCEIGSRMAVNEGLSMDHPEYVPTAEQRKSNERIEELTEMLEELRSKPKFRVKPQKKSSWAIWS